AAAGRCQGLAGSSAASFDILQPISSLRDALSTDRTSACMEVNMRKASGILVLSGAIGALGSVGLVGVGQARGAEEPSSGVNSRRTGYQPGRGGRGLSVRWIGQDGHDYVSASDRHEPDERQDIHLTLAGLDPSRDIAFIDITLPNGHRWQYNPQ